mgnify:FL=1
MPTLTGASATCVLELGPGAVRRLWPDGAVCADDEAVSAALDVFDDGVVLLGDVAFDVPALWRRIVEPLCSPGHRSVVVVHPSWWSKRRIERVVEGLRPLASGDVADPVTAVTRTQFFAGAKRWRPDAAAVLIEIGVALITIGDGAGLAAVLDRATDVDRIVDEALRRGGAPATVLIDEPIGMPGADEFVDRIRKALSDRGVRSFLTRADEVAAETVSASHSDHPDVDGGVRRRFPRPRVVAAVSAAALLCAGGVAAATAGRHQYADPLAADASTLVVEGRISVRVPLGWKVETLTAGPGSRRIRAMSSESDGVALHFTQSYVADQTLAGTAETLEQVLAGEAPDVFRDFDAHGHRAGRMTVTYREVRGPRMVDWSIVVDGSTRIGVGCESPPDLEAQVRAVCDDAIESAHEIRAGN